MNILKCLSSIANKGSLKIGSDINLVEGQDTNIFSDPDSWWMINTAPWGGDTDSVEGSGLIANALLTIFK